MTPPRLLKRRAFTLIEVLLAISITLGMFVIVLFFYHQASTTRAAVLAETEKVTAARMILGQLTSELRSAIADPDAGVGLRGSATSIRLATLGIPPGFANGAVSTNSSSSFETGLRIVSYSSLGIMEAPEEIPSTNAPSQTPQTTPDPLLPIEALPEPLTNSLPGASAPGGIERSEEPLVLSSFLGGDSPAIGGASLAQLTVPVATTFLTDRLKYITFRYFDGSGYRSSWNSSFLPLAVEITLSNEPILPTTEGQTLPEDFFRRLVFLPNADRSAATNKEALFLDDLGL
jgi:hypothetical protein